MNAAMLIFAVSFILINVVSGTGATRQALIIESISITVYITFIYLSVEIIHWPVEAVWLSEIIYWLIIGVMSWAYIRSMKWMKIVV